MTHTRFRGAAVVATAAAALALPAAAQAWPGLNGRVGLTENPRTKDLWAFALDGTATQLTFTGNDEQQPSWAPDGRRIAYKRSDEVFTRDVTSDAAPVRLTVKTNRDENNTQPAWSPDGASIIFRTNRADPTQNVGDVWIMDADGSRERPLLVLPDDQRYPTFSPDGTQLAYTSRNAAGNADVWVANADGTGAHLVYDSGLDDSAPAWSPDGTRLAFERHGPVGGEDGDVFVLDLATGGVMQLTEEPSHDEGPAWSPDGTMIAFTSERLDPNGDVWIMQSDGSDQRRLTTNQILDESPDWQPIPTTIVPAVPCGDVSVAPGGASSVVADGPRGCRRALRLASEWTPETPGCTRTPHSFDQERVECNGELAFVWRRP